MVEEEPGVGSAEQPDIFALEALTEEAAVSNRGEAKEAKDRAVPQTLIAEAVDISGEADAVGSGQNVEAAGMCRHQIHRRQPAADVG